MKAAAWIQELLLALLEGALRAWATSLTLILANLIPLIGVLWFDWTPGSVLFLFSAETTIIGILTMPKLALVSGWRALIYVPATVFLLLSLSFYQGTMSLSMAHLARHAGTIFDGTAMNALLREMSLPVTVFAVSHGWSFLYHFLWRGEFRRITPWRVAVAYISRIGMLQVGFWAAILISSQVYSPIGLLLTLVAAKTVLDLWLHLKEHGMLLSAQEETCPDDGAAAPDQTPRKDPGAAFSLGLFFGPIGMLYATVRGAVVMLLLMVPLGALGFALSAGLAIWTGYVNAAQPTRFSDFVLVFGTTWLFAFLPCGYWAWRTVRSHNRPHESQSARDVDRTRNA